MKLRLDGLPATLLDMKIEDLPAALMEVGVSVGVTSAELASAVSLFPDGNTSLTALARSDAEDVEASLEQGAHRDVALALVAAEPLPALRQHLRSEHELKAEVDLQGTGQALDDRGTKDLAGLSLHDAQAELMQLGIRPENLYAVPGDTAASDGAPIMTLSAAPPTAGVFGLRSIRGAGTRCTCCAPTVTGVFCSAWSFPMVRGACADWQSSSRAGMLSSSAPATRPRSIDPTAVQVNGLAGGRGLHLLGLRSARSPTGIQMDRSESNAEDPPEAVFAIFDASGHLALEWVIEAPRGQVPPGMLGQLDDVIRDGRLRIRRRGEGAQL